MGFNNDRSGFGCSTSAKVYDVEDYPLTLPDIKRLKTLSILGNSAQDGTPSPDNPVEVVGTGELQEDGRYKITVQASGRNLFDYIYFWDNCKSGNLSSLVYGLKPNTSYTISTNVPTGGGYASVFIAPGVTETATTTENGVSMNNNRTVTTDNTGKLTVLLRAVSVTEAIAVTKNDFESGKYWILLAEGSYTADTLPPYEPYKSPQSFNVYIPDVLHGVGDAHDTVILDFDKRKAEFVKYAGYFDLNNIAYLNSGSMDGALYRYYSAANPPMRVGAGLAGFCSVLPESPLWAGNTTEIIHFGQQNSAIYFIVNNQYDNKDDLIAYLSNKGQSTSYVIYPLATPTTTDITALQDWEALPPLKGTWVLTVEGGTEPLLKATYTSNTDPYTDYSSIVSVLPVYPDEDIEDTDTAGEQGEDTSTGEPNTSADTSNTETVNSVDTIDMLDLYE